MCQASIRQECLSWSLVIRLCKKFMELIEDEGRPQGKDDPCPHARSASICAFVAGTSNSNINRRFAVPQ